MAQRNIQTYIEAGKKRADKHPQYRINAIEGYHLLYDNKNELDLMLNAFYMGVEAGARMTRQQAR